MHSVGKPLFQWFHLLKDSQSEQREIFDQLEKALALGPEGLQASGWDTRLATLRRRHLSELASESALLLAGRYKPIAESEAQLGTPPEGLEPDEKAFWASRVFLAGLAARRMGDETRSKKLWFVLEATQELLQHEYLAVKLQWQEAALLMNKGHFEVAESKVSEILVEKTKYLDVHTHIGCLSVQGTCLQAMGRFPEAKSTLLQEKQLLEKINCSFLQSAFQRRQVSFYLEQDDEESAERILKEAWALAKGSPFTQALLRQMRLKIQLNQLHFDAAREEFLLLEKHLQENNILAQNLSLVEERCEFALTDHNVADGLAALKDALWKSLTQADICGECVAKLYMSRLSFFQGQFEDARSSLAGAMQIAREQHYGKLLLKISFFAAGMAFQKNNLNAFFTNLEQAGKLARGMGLPRQSACYQYLKDLVSQFEVGPVAVAQMFHMQVQTRQALHLMSLFGIKEPENILVKQKGLPEKLICFTNFREFSNAPDKNFWVARERKLLRLAKGQLQTLDLTVSSLQNRFVLLLFKKRSKGVSFEDLTQLQWGDRVSFHPERHGPGLRSLVSRVRKILVDFNLSLEFDKKNQVYVLDFDSGFCEVKTLHLEQRVGVLKPLRQTEVLAYLEIHQRCSTKELCDHFKITRQALHRHVSALTQQGFVRLVKRGPRTAYVYCKN